MGEGKRYPEDELRKAAREYTFDGWARAQLIDAVEELIRLRRVEDAARVVTADDHQMRSVHSHWEALYEALGVPRGTEAARWAAGQAGRHGG